MKSGELKPEFKTRSVDKTFDFYKRAYLKDTNAEGNVYFARYFEWQGEAREDFFRQAVPDHMAILQSGTKLITVHSWLKYEHETYLFDEIIIQIQTLSLKKLTMELGFTYLNKNNGKIIAVGGQKLGFSDSSGKLIPIPPSIRDGAATCLVEEGADILHMQLLKKKAEHRSLDSD